jgi:hypothetical protein
VGFLLEMGKIKKKKWKRKKKNGILRGQKRSKKKKRERKINTIDNLGFARFKLGGPKMVLLPCWQHLGLAFRQCRSAFQKGEEHEHKNAQGGNERDFKPPDFHVPKCSTPRQKKGEKRRMR